MELVLAGKTCSKLFLGSTLGGLLLDTEDLGLLDRTVVESLSSGSRNQSMQI